MVHGLSCSEACGIIPDQGSNLCLMHCQVVSYPLHHQGRPAKSFLLWKGTDVISLGIRMWESLGAGGP